MGIEIDNIQLSGTAVPIYEWLGYSFDNISKESRWSTGSVPDATSIVKIASDNKLVLKDDYEFYDDAEVEFTTHLLTTTETTTLTTPSSTISSSIPSSSTSITPILTTKADYEGSGNSTGGSGDGDESATSNESEATEADKAQTDTKNNSDYEDMNIKILNEPFKDEDLLRKALEMSLQE